MDLDTFFTVLYVLVDDWYQAEIAANMRRRKGGRMKMSDSEVLTVGLAGQWRIGVPWQSERGLVRYLQAHGRGWFPGMLQRSAFNLRLRQLWGALVQLQQVVAASLECETDVFECVDSLPLPAYSLGQAARESGHWLWQSTLGRGQYGEWFWGDHLLVSVLRGGAITGWLVGAAHINDRWLLQAFLSARAGTPHLQGPVPRKRDGRKAWRLPPHGFIGAWTAVGGGHDRPYLTDQGFNGGRWRRHWRSHYRAQVLSVPPANAVDEPPWSVAWKHWLAHHRQIIETVFAALDSVFGIKVLNAHSRWGQYARLAAKTAAYNVGLFINRLFNRPEGALATLLC
jgi:hypothetical protein